MRKIISAILVGVMIISLAACAGTADNTGQSDLSDSSKETSSNNSESSNTAQSKEKVEFLAAKGNLMKDIAPKNIKGEELDHAFRADTINFAVELFKQSYAKDMNTLISPVSVELALAMTANGAGGQTKAQFESLFGTDSMDNLNKSLFTLSKTLQKSKDDKVKIANSIWYDDRENLLVNKQFLQKNADYYGAGAYKLGFSQPETLDIINGWVKDNTDGLIDKMVDEISPEVILYLMNTVLFDAQWKTPYSKTDVTKNDFFAPSGSVNTEFMISEEQTYVKDNNSEGFIKPYKDQYSFMALLPNEGVSIDSYVASLTGERISKIIKNKTEASVNAFMPSFESRHEIEMREGLSNMGLKDAFNEKADFSQMVEVAYGKVFISRVIHKTYIKVDKQGTKAAAATGIEIKNTAMPMYDHTINLNRPFVYAIIDNESEIPLFIGTVLNPTK